MEEMTLDEFLDKYEDQFYEFAFDDISMNKEDYFDGYTSYTDKDFDEVLFENKESLLSLFLEEKNIKLIRGGGEI